MQTSAPGSVSRRRVTIILLSTALALCGLSFVSMVVGGGDVGVARSLDYLWGDAVARQDEQLAMVMRDLRLPRTVVAVLAGVALGVAGCLLQSVTRNPLAETGLLGVNAGAALAVVIGIATLSAQAAWLVLALALLGALGASAIVLLVASGAKLTPLRLVLAGVALSATFRGATSFLLMRDGSTYDQYRFWVLGSLSGVTLDQTGWVLPVVLAGLAIAALLVRPLGALALGDDVAAGLGHRPRVIRLAAAGAVTLLTGATVALCGPIAFLGLLAPHLARAFAGPRLGLQLALSAVWGAAIMIAADVLARVAIAPYEAPASVLLALLGGPMLIVLARSHRGMTLSGGRGVA